MTMQTSGTVLAKDSENPIEVLDNWDHDNIEVANCLKYFSNKTQNKRLPRRADINPTEIKSILPEIALFELILDEEKQFKDVLVTLQGTLLDSFYGQMTGKLMSEHASTDVFQRVDQVCRACIQHRAPCLIAVQQLTMEKSYMTARILYVPMSEDNQLIDRVFVHSLISYKGGYNPTSFKRRPI